jgi:hypothetical protein
VPKFKEDATNRPPLSEVTVGEWVWQEAPSRHTRHGERPPVRSLTQITHVNRKGQLFICAPKPELLRKPGYAFDPTTGTAKHYTFVLRAMTPEEKAQHQRKMELAAAAEQRRSELRKTQAWQDAEALLWLSNECTTEELIKKYGAERLRKALAALNE